MDDLALLNNAAASFEEVARNGEASNAADFPRPIVGDADRVTAKVYSPITGEEADVRNIVYEKKADGAMPTRGYWLGRILKEAIYGVVRSATILRVRHQAGKAISWETTNEKAAVKIMSWDKIREMRGQHMEDPVKEVSAMQFVSRDGCHRNVLGTLDVLKDNEYLYSFMPFCSEGELFAFVKKDGHFSEPVARYWFKQILDGLGHLQRMGICHRDLSLENILVDKRTQTLIIDFGMCLRVPFGADDGSVVDERAGALRRLLKPQGRCGKPNYISPEVLQNTEPFDGYAIDVWAAGIILFIMLVGLPPFEWAHPDDPRYRMITKGGLMTMLQKWNRPISEAAGDLLQRMLRADPRDRLSLTEVIDHEWIQGGESIMPSEQPMEMEDWRKM